MIATTAICSDTHVCHVMMHNQNQSVNQPVRIFVSTILVAPVNKVPLIPMIHQLCSLETAASHNLRLQRQFISMVWLDTGSPAEEPKEGHHLFPGKRKSKKEKVQQPNTTARKHSQRLCAGPSSNESQNQ